MAYRGIVLPSMLVGLINVALQSFVGARSGVSRLLEQELDGCLSLCNANVTLHHFGKESDPSRWRDEQRFLVLQFSGTIILYIIRDLPIPFTWAQELVSASLKIYEFASCARNLNIAGFECTFSYFGVLINY